MKRPYQIALEQYGVHEIKGANHNQRIIDYAHETENEWVKDDETAWCSIFVNWCFKKAGFNFDWKPNARSWIERGKPVDLPELGDLVIFRRGNSSWQGHVAFFISRQGDYLNVLGGNQSDQVKISKYKVSDVITYRRFKRWMESS